MLWLVPWWVEHPFDQIWTLPPVVTVTDSAIAQTTMLNNVMDYIKVDAVVVHFQVFQSLSWMQKWLDVSYACLGWSHSGDAILFLTTSLGFQPYWWMWNCWHILTKYWSVMFCFNRCKMPEPQLHSPIVNIHCSWQESFTCRNVDCLFLSLYIITVNLLSEFTCER